MKNKKLVVGGLLAVLLSLGIAGSSLAYQSDYTKKGRNYSLDREAQMVDIMNKSDYEGWKNFMNGKGMVTNLINKDNFSKFVEAWKLSKAGKMTEADAIRKELGLKTSTDTVGRMQGKRNGQNKGVAIGSRGSLFVDKNNDGVCDNQNK